MSRETMKVDGLNRPGITREPVNFPSNSKKSKAEATDKKIEKVVTGKVLERKKSVSKKFAELVTGDDGSDMNSVFTYVVRDILLPSAKSMIYDIVTGGLEMKLFSTTGGKRGKSSRDRDKPYTSYSSCFRTDTRDRDRDSDRRSSAARNRARHNFDDIVLESRGEAEDVIEHLIDLTIDFGVASVADLYDLVGIESNFTDNNYGWDYLTTDIATCSRIREGYLLNLPKTKSLKD